jgi:hypothetical protein
MSVVAVRVRSATSSKVYMRCDAIICADEYNLTRCAWSDFQLPKSLRALSIAK